MVGPLDQGGDHATVRRAGLQHAQRRVVDADAAEIACPEVVRAFRRTQRGRLEPLHGVHDSVARFVEHHVEPRGVDLEGRVGPVVVVRGRHQDVHVRAHVLRQSLCHAPAQFRDVGRKQHVQVGRHDHGDARVALALQGQRPHAQVVAHPVRVGAAVADVNGTLVERLDKDAR